MITSQENSALWIGTFDFEVFEFIDPENDRIYHFPRDNHCEMVMGPRRSVWGRCLLVAASALRPALGGAPRAAVDLYLH